MVSKCYVSVSVKWLPPKNNMRMLRDFKALSFQVGTNVSFLQNVSTYHKSPQLSYIVSCYAPVNHFVKHFLKIHQNALSF